MFFSANWFTARSTRKTLGRGELSRSRPALEGLESRLNPSGSYGGGIQMTSDGFVEANQVQQLCGNILHRNPDSAGLANWTAKLESGQANLAQVAQSFIHSPEAVRNMVTQAYT